MGNSCHAYFTNPHGEEFVLHAGEEWFHVCRMRDGRFYIGKHWIHSRQPTLDACMIDGIIARDIEVAYSWWGNNRNHAMFHLTIIVLYAYYGSI